MQPKAHPSIAHARINIGASLAVRRQYTLLPMERGYLCSRCGRVQVVLNTNEDLPLSVVGVVADGQVTQDYSIIYNGGKKKRNRFSIL